MSSSSLREQVATNLRCYYDDEHIAPAAFNCVHKVACTADAAPRPLTHGAEAHVGRRYGQVLRIVVISLDTGGGSDSLERRTQIIEDLAGHKMNPHMQGTTLLLEALLKPDIGGDTPFPYFAMINAAKCAATDERRDMVPTPLYERCKAFARRELAILDADIVVAQRRTARAVLPRGERIARGAVQHAMAANAQLPDYLVDWLNAVAQEYVRRVELGSRKTVALITPHPSARGGQWQRFVRISLSPLAWLARQLVESGRAV